MVVVADPGDDPLLAPIPPAVLRGLAGGGHTATVLDLHDEGFDPVMRAEQRRSYEEAGAAIPADIAAHAAAVTSADGLVLVYPTWTSSTPAMLKGWLDRVLVPGVAFHLDRRSNRVRSDLRRIRRLGAVTVSERPMSRGRRRPDTGRWTVTRTLRLLASWRCRTFWLSLDDAGNRSEAERNLFEAQVEVAMSRL